MAAGVAGSRRPAAHRRRGSRTAPSTTTYKSPLDATGRAAASGRPRRPCSDPQADALAAIIGDFVWLYGGHDDNGPVGAVQRGRLGLEAAEGFPENPDQGKVVGWDINNAVEPAGAHATTPPAGPRTAPCICVGGADAEGPQARDVLVDPDNDGDDPRVEAPASQRPAGRRARRRAPS